MALTGRCARGSSTAVAPDDGGVVAAAVTGVVQRLASSTTVSGLSDFVQGVEAGINDLVFLGIAIYFLASIEGRLKRRTALRRIHQLRSIAHIVDMHQLTKDPEYLTAPARGHRLVASAHA